MICCIVISIQVYVWGSHAEGQLGLGDDVEESYYSPQLLNLDFKVDIESLTKHLCILATSSFWHLFVTLFALIFCSGAEYALFWCYLGEFSEQN